MGINEILANTNVKEIREFNYLINTIQWYERCKKDMIS